MSNHHTDNAAAIASAQLPSSLPGEKFEVRQTHKDGDYTPDPSKSLPLSPARQALVDDIIELYSCRPTIERVKRYTRDCVYDDQFVYANDRFKMAGQWFALPKLFKVRFSLTVLFGSVMLMKIFPHKGVQMREVPSRRERTRPDPIPQRAELDLSAANLQNRNHQRSRLTVPRSIYYQFRLYPGEISQGSSQRQGL